MKKNNMKLPQAIAVIHLPALPGAPGAAGKLPDRVLREVRKQAVDEAKTLTRLGYDGIILENFGDIPFEKGQVAPETVAAFAIVASAVREVTACSLGINVLRNDAKSALSIAAAVGAQFIRVNVLSGVAATDQGIIEGDARGLQNDRTRLSAQHITILSDVLVKHARILSETDPEVAIEEATLRAGAHGVIVTGSTTGRLPDPELWRTAIQTTQKIDRPLWLGSGANEDCLESWRQDPSNIPHGVIIGSAIKKGGIAGNSLDPKRAQKMLKLIRSVL